MIFQNELQNLIYWHVIFMWLITMTCGGISWGIFKLYFLKEEKWSAIGVRIGSIVTILLFLYTLNLTLDTIIAPYYTIEQIYLK